MSTRRLSALEVAFAGVFTFGGCIEAGGGGSLFTPPAAMYAGEPTSLQIEFVVPAGDAKRRFNNPTCAYRVLPEVKPKVRELTFVRIREDRQGVVYKCDLPAFPDGAEIEYWFEVSFDGKRMKRFGPRTVVSVRDDSEK